MGVEGRSAEGPEDGGRKPLEPLRGGCPPGGEADSRELPANSLASCASGPGISGHSRDLTGRWGHQALPRGHLTFTSPALWGPAVYGWASCLEALRDRGARVLLRSLTGGTFHSSTPQTAPSSPTGSSSCAAASGRTTPAFGSRAWRELHSPRKSAPAAAARFPHSPRCWRRGRGGAEWSAGGRPLCSAQRWRPRTTCVLKRACSTAG